MPAIIHCVRHAQGFHNLGSGYWNIPDPKLTPLGIEQCLTLKNSLWQNQSQLSLIAASPLSRTLHTASIVFEHALTNGKAENRILAVPDAQETSDLPCDRGSDPDVLKRICDDQHWPVNLSMVTDGWNNKMRGTRNELSCRAIKRRAKDARWLLRNKITELEASGVENPQIVLVAHGGYLHYFTDDWEYSNKMIGTGWENCETRSYVFESGDDDPDARLVETMESRHRRGLDYAMMPKEKQSEMFKQSLRQWADQGLQDISAYEQDLPTEEHDQLGGEKLEVTVKA